MAVSESDVLHVAALARVAIEPGRLPSLVRELNGILEHMDVLNAVEVGGQMADGRGETTATSMRSDNDGASVSLTNPRESFAPLMRDGFFLVPRLATHEDQGERAP
jgi:aspartyl-tRNA(Asn)/glutamyl-tRNA(Gln) amidotransferase subunit C